VSRCFATFSDNRHLKRYTIFHHRGSSCQYTNIAAKIAELSLKRLFASQKPTSSPPARTVTAQALEKKYPPLFHLEQDHLLPPALLETAAESAVDFPEGDKVNGRVPSSQNHT
jgi:hypothetical protein